MLEHSINMYTVNKAPSKLVAKSRSSLSQNYEKIETIKDIGRKCAIEPLKGGSGRDANEIKVAKPVFQQYRQPHSYRLHMDARQHQADQPQPSPQYEELVKYIRDSWNMVVGQGSIEYEQQNQQQQPQQQPQHHQQQKTNDSLDHHHHNDSRHIPLELNAFNDAQKSPDQQVSSNARKVNVVYHNDPPSPVLKDFGAFDLESWWGRRLFNNITKSL